MRLLFLVDICALRGKESCWELAKPAGAICSAPWLQARLWQCVKRKGMHAVIWRSSDRVTDLPLPSCSSLLPCHLCFVWVPLAEGAAMGHGDAPALSLSKGVACSDKVKNYNTEIHQHTSIKLAMLNRTFSFCCIQRGATVRAYVAATEGEASCIGACPQQQFLSSYPPLWLKQAAPVWQKGAVTTARWA